MTWAIGINGSGAVLLGPDLVADGFRHDRPYRVQTHVHDDHMEDFETSKGNQHIFLTAETRELLCAERNADLPYRDNLVSVASGDVVQVGSCRLRLVRSGHMLGAVQAEAELESGLRLGYSGDFSWPLDEAIRVDELVLDSTYGSPNSLRHYSQGDAEAALVGLVLSKVRFGPVHIKAHRGTVQRCLQVLQADCRVPFVASPTLAREIAVYQRFGYPISPVTLTSSDEGRRIMATEPYVKLYAKGDPMPVDYDGTSIVISAFMVDPRTPLLEFSNRSYKIGMSNHADFAGTLEYVEATGARRVLTDNTRGPHGVELAIALRRLGIDAMPSDAVETLSWGT